MSSKFVLPPANTVISNINNQVFSGSTPYYGTVSYNQDRQVSIGLVVERDVAQRLLAEATKQELEKRERSEQLKTRSELREFSSAVAELLDEAGIEGESSTDQEAQIDRLSDLVQQFLDLRDSKE